MCVARFALPFLPAPPPKFRVDEKHRRGSKDEPSKPAVLMWERASSEIIYSVACTDTLRHVCYGGRNMKVIVLGASTALWVAPSL